MLGQGGTTATGAKALGETTRQGLARVAYWRMFINLALMLIDVATFIIVAAVVMWLRGEDAPESLRFGFTFNVVAYLVICACLWAWGLKRAGIYHRHVMGDGYQFNALLTKGVVYAAVLWCAFDYVLDLSLTLTTLAWIVVCTWLLTMGERSVMRVLIARGRSKGRYSYDTVVLGSPEGIARVLRLLGAKQQLSYRPVAVCPIRLGNDGQVVADRDLEAVRAQMAEAGFKNLPVLAYDDERLAERVVMRGAQTVMVADVLRRFSDNFNVFALRMESLNLEVTTLTSAVDIAGHEMQMRTLQGVTMMTLRLSQYSPWERLKKRLFDICFSLVAIILSSPIMLAVAIAIKAEDHGPVFYSQERIGLRGKPFKIHKFRSMKVNADAHLAEVAAENGQEMGARVKIKHDPRITRVGAFIRRTSLDELPQFFDVLTGSMSVVGPRPQRDFEVQSYDQFYATRLLVKPGITGPWQVSGRNDLSEEESRELDVSYVQDWSLVGDIICILRTIGVVINPKGAY